MLSDKTTMALYDIRDNALYAHQFIEDITFEAFQVDRKTFYAENSALAVRAGAKQSCLGV